MNPTKFGTYLRALRLGYRWSEKHHAWVRMSIIDDERIRVEVEVEPGTTNIDGHDRVKEFVVWWEDSDPEKLLDMCEPLRSVESPSRKVTFVVNNEGVVARQMPKSKPTLEELEAILNSGEELSIEILPNGEVRVK